MISNHRRKNHGKSSRQESIIDKQMSLMNYLLVKTFDSQEDKLKNIDLQIKLLCLHKLGIG